MIDITGNELHKETYAILDRVRDGEDFRVLQGPKGGAKAPVATLEKIAAVPPPPPPPPGDPQPVGWTGSPLALKFNDNFADLSKWESMDQASGAEYGMWARTAAKPSNNTISNGELHCAFHPNQPYAGGVHNGSLLHTFGRFSFTFGYAEFRAKMPHNGANWAGLWTNADSHPGSGPDWPINGELDVVETFAKNNPVAHIHGPSSRGGGGDIGRGCGGRYIADADTVFHTYAVEWRQDKIRFLYDGSEIGSYTGYCFGDSPHHLLIYLVAPLDGGPVNAADEMVVDHVRVWQ